MTKLKGGFSDYAKDPKTATLQKHNSTNTGVLFIVSQSRACLSHTKPAPAGTFYDVSCSQGHHVRGRVYGNVCRT
jgi:hypothetical protein